MTRHIQRAATAAFLFLAACACPDAQMAAADLATYEWFAPQMRAYLEADAQLDAAAKATHLRALDAWGQRVIDAAKRTGVK
jgi:hypothetical protein